MIFSHCELAKEKKLQALSSSKVFCTEMTYVFTLCFSFPFLISSNNCLNFIRSLSMRNILDLSMRNILDTMPYIFQCISCVLLFFKKETA